MKRLATKQLHFLAKATLLTLAFCAILPAAWAAEDKEGCADIPGIKRFAGSHISDCSTRNFVEYTLPTGKRSGGTFEHKEELEGKIVALTYKTAAGTSSLEVFRNYSKDLTASGFKILYEAKKADAGGLKNEMVSSDCEMEDPYYAAALKEVNGVKTYVALWAANSGGDKVHICLDQLTVGKINTDQMVTASAMQESLNETGHINLYGIHFDFDKDIVKPESQPTIGEMSKLMRSNPQLRLQVVGHTDSQGNDAHNKDLSNRRAASVIQALIQTGIDTKRLTSRGAGASEPVAPNETEEGRAKNRRVELVQQ